MSTVWHKMTQSYNLQLSCETQSSYIFFVCLCVFVFDQLLWYWNSFAVVFLAIKIKTGYLHVSYKQLLDHLCIHIICITVKYTEKSEVSCYNLKYYCQYEPMVSHWYVLLNFSMPFGKLMIDKTLAINEE